LESERNRYIKAYDELVAEVSANKDWKIDTMTLRHSHDRTVGGGVLRKESLCAGRHDHLFPEPEEVADLLEGLFADLHSEDTHPDIAGTQAHLDLLTVHPFRGWKRSNSKAGRNSSAR
jgi:hypothetical protein